MKAGKYFFIITLLSAVMQFSLAQTPTETPAQTPPTTTTPPVEPEQEKPEVLTSGPVHEAYAEPVNANVQQGVIAPKAPPENINETPPTQKPEGENYYWVPGYWSWDSTRNDYIWVSGCWRVAPPNTYWVPGYWTQVDNGWEWVAGFWAPITDSQIQYLPKPPDVDYTVPSNEGNPDSMWVPPCYYWYNNQYILRQGYWLPQQQNWVWMPSCYLWTPRGYIFRAGRWDYPFEQRGLLFSPVYFHSHNFGIGFSFSPGIVVNIGSISLSLFTYPRYCHYFYGDYYDNTYLNAGIYPWFDFQYYHTWYDPIYEYDRWHHRHDDPHWSERQRSDYEHYRSDRNIRPSRTYDQMQTRLASMPESQRKNFRTAEPLNTFVSSRITTKKFQTINPEDHRNYVLQATAVHQYRQARQKWETPTGAAAPKTTTPKETTPRTTAPGETTPRTTAPTEKPRTNVPGETPKTKVPAETPGTTAPSIEHQAPVTTGESKPSPAPIPKSRPAPTYTAPHEIHGRTPESIKVSPSPIQGKGGHEPSRPSGESSHMKSESSAPKGDGDQHSDGALKSDGGHGGGGSDGKHK